MEEKSNVVHESISNKKSKNTFWIFLMSGSFFLILGFVCGYSLRQKPPITNQISTNKTDLPVTNQQIITNSGKELWWNSILSTKLLTSRTWKDSGKNGVDVCGYTENELKEMVSLEEFKKPLNNAVVNWETAIWSPQCTRILFTIDTNLGKGPSPLSPHQGSWIYDIPSKKRYKLPIHPILGFINDGLILVDGYSDRSYLKGYDVFDIKSNRIITNIRPSTIRYRNPLFPWSFLYGIEWEYLPNELIISNNKIEKIVFKIGGNLKMEFYRSIPQFDKSPYEIQKRPISLEGSKKGDYPLTQYFIRKTRPNTDNVVDCEKWYTNDVSKDTPAAIHFVNRDKEKKCQYDITTRIDNEWLNGNGFQFNYEFGE